MNTYQIEDFHIYSSIFSYPSFILSLLLSNSHTTTCLQCSFVHAVYINFDLPINLVHCRAYLVSTVILDKFVLRIFCIMFKFTFLKFCYLNATIFSSMKLLKFLSFHLSSENQSNRLISAYMFCVQIEWLNNI